MAGCGGPDPVLDEPGTVVQPCRGGQRSTLLSQGGLAAGPLHLSTTMVSTACISPLGPTVPRGGGWGTIGQLYSLVGEDREAPCYLREGWQLAPLPLSPKMVSTACTSPLPYPGGDSRFVHRPSVRSCPSHISYTVIPGIPNLIYILGTKTSLL